MKKILWLLFVLVTNIAVGQAVQQTGAGIKAVVNDIDIEVKFYSPDIIRVIKSPKGSVYKKESLSVIKVPSDVPLSIDQQDAAVRVKSDAVTVKLDLQTGKISFANRNGNVLLNEKEDGIQFTPVKDAGSAAFDVRQAFMLDKEEVIYGLGQQQNGSMSQRFQKVFLRQDNMKVCIPFFQSIKGYGLFLG